MATVPNTSRRLAEWNFQSRRETDACRADYFTVVGRPGTTKMRVDLTEPSWHTASSVTTPWPWTLLCVAMTLVVITMLLFLWKWRIRADFNLYKTSSSSSSLTKEKCLEPPKPSEDLPNAKRVPSSVSSSVATTEKLDDSTDLPLPQEEVNGHIQVMTDQPPLMTVPSCAAAFTVEEAQLRAHEMTVALDVATTQLQKAGHTVEPKDLIAWVTQLQISSLERAEKSEREARRLVFASTQHERNRAQAATLHREDAAWLQRIRDGCDRLVGEVEQSIGRVLLVEICLQAAVWFHNTLEETSDNTEDVFQLLAVKVCRACSAEMTVGVFSVPLSMSPGYTNTINWLFCIRRLVMILGAGYAWVQVRSILPTVVRELYTTVTLGTACFLTLSWGFVPWVWQGMALLAVLGYLGAHWQFFATKSMLQRLFPETNPSSHTVNQTLATFDTLGRCYRVLPVVLVVVHAVGFVLSNSPRADLPEEM